MKKKFILGGKLLLKQLDTVLTHLTLVTLTFDPVTPKSIGFLCCLGLMCGPGMRKVGYDVSYWSETVMQI
mgnify:FL=1